MNVEAALSSISRKEVVRLVTFLRTHLRHYQRSPIRTKPYAECVLPAVRERWGPRPARDEWKAEWEWAGPRFLEFEGFIVDSLRWFGRDATRRLVGSLGAPPKTYEDVYVSLLATFVQRLRDESSGPRIVPCLACGHFLVATRMDAETCSPACRQRWYRTNLDETGRERLRQKRRAYKKKQRGKERLEQVARRQYEATHGAVSDERWQQLLASARERVLAPRVAM